MLNPSSGWAASAPTRATARCSRRPSRRPARPSWRSTSSVRRPTPTARRVLEGDILSVSGSNYREQYRALRIAHPELTNIVYAHADRSQRSHLAAVLAVVLLQRLPAVVRARDARGRLGDRQAADGQQVRPSRHRDLRPAPLWRGARVDAVEQLAGRPVVYVARGSHASYFEAGFHQTEAWYDLADGKRRMKHRPRLEILGDDHPAWPLWTGRWGDTVPRSGRESKAPRGREQRSNGRARTRCSTTRRTPPCNTARPRRRRT